MTGFGHPIRRYMRSTTLLAGSAGWSFIVDSRPVKPELQHMRGARPGRRIGCRQRRPPAENRVARRRHGRSGAGPTVLPPHPTVLPPPPTVLLPRPATSRPGSPARTTRRVTAAPARVMRNRRTRSGRPSPRTASGARPAAAVAGSLSAVTWAPDTPAPAGPPPGPRRVRSWSAAPVAGTEIPGCTCPTGSGPDEQTVRDVVYLGVGGDAVRVTNAFGTRPLRMGHVSAAVQAFRGRTPRPACGR
jgi:hypothetical protein